MTFLALIGPGRFIDPAVIQASAARGDEWYPYAAKMPLTPEAASQPRGDKTTFILHTQSGPHLTTLEALVAYMNRTDITGECTWILDFDGRCAQLVPVDTRADNNYLANPFATSVETQDIGYVNDPGITKTPWSDQQLAQLAGLSAWQVLNPRVSVPLRRADRGWAGGGIDGHRRYAEWSKYVGKTCPGEARWRQIPDVLDAARGIVEWSPAPAPPPPPDPPTPMEAQMLAAIGKTTDGAYLAQFEFRGPIYTVGETAAHDVSQAEVFGRGGGRAYNIVDRTVVSWSPENPGSWSAVKATKTVAQVRALMGATA